MLIFWVSTVSIPKDRFAFDVDRGYIGLNIEWYFMDKLCITGNKRILLEYITVRTKKENLILNKFMFYLSISFSFSLYMSLFFLFPLCLSPSLVSHFLSFCLTLSDFFFPCVSFSPGWQGVHCNLPCENGYYGDGCSRLCDCGNGASCDAVTGECECTPGWLQPTCLTACNVSSAWRH